MPNKCCVRFCYSTSTKNKDKELLFFPWPKSENITDKWLHEFAVHSNITGYSQKFFTITKSMRICNLHFERNCFSKETNTLLKDAVPTIFQFTKKPTYAPLHSHVVPLSTVTDRSTSNNTNKQTSESPWDQQSSINISKANQVSVEPVLPERSPVVPKKTYSNRKNSLVSSSSSLQLENNSNINIEERDNLTSKIASNPSETVLPLPSTPTGNFTKLANPIRSNLTRPTVSQVPVSYEIRHTPQNKQQQSSINKTSLNQGPSSQVSHQELILRPILPAAEDFGQVKLAVSCRELLNPKEAILPPSWSWQECFLQKKHLICSKFKWLDEYNFEYTKSIIVGEYACVSDLSISTHTVRYFVRGRQVFPKTLKSQFSTVSELTTYLKFYDDIPECVGYSDPKLLGSSPPLNPPQTNRSKKCLLLASEKSIYCTECLSIMPPTIKRNLVNNSNNLSNSSNLPSTNVNVIRPCNTITPVGMSADPPLISSGDGYNICEIAEDESTVENRPNEDYRGGDPSEPNVLNHGESQSELSSDLESEDSASVVESDSEYSPDGIVESDSEYSLNGSSSPENEIDVDDDGDFAMAQCYLQNEVMIKRRLKTKFLRYSTMLNKSKEIARSILKASKEFELKCRNGKLRLHTAKKSGPKKQCNECGKMIHAKGFQDHLKLHSGIKSHLCELCGRGFVFRSSLNSHIRLNHRGEERTKPLQKFMCSTCGHTVSSKERLGIHERIHTDDRPFECKYCDKRFREKGTLVRHIRTHTGERPFECNICGKSYRSRSAFVGHYRAKHETKENEIVEGPVDDLRKHPKIGYRCEYCGKEFCQGRILAYEKHLTTHTGISAAIRCTQPDCEFTYSDMTQLKEHMLSQHPGKAYTCDVCKKIFLTKQSLTDHTSMHDPSRGYQCSYCPVKLTVKASLIAHEKLHTRETPHECNFCEMRFHSTYLLQIHMRTHQPSQLKRKRYRKPVEK